MNEIDDSLQLLENKKTRRTEKFHALAKLKDFSVSVPMYRARKGTLRPLRGRDVFLLNMRYTSNYGLEPSEAIENIF
jgi:hypothetical protein